MMGQAKQLPGLWMLAGAIAAASGCNRDALEPRLLAGDGQPSSSQEEERMRRAELIRVINASGETEEILEMTTEEFIANLRECGLPCGPESGCSRGSCDMRIEQCAAEIMLAIAEGTGVPITLSMNVTGVGEFEARIPPQGAATNAALALDAARKFEIVMRDAVQLSTGREFFAVACDAIEEPTPFTDGFPLMEVIGASFMDSFFNGQRAYRTAYENTLAVSDAELGSSEQSDIARIRAISRSRLSRAAAAHMMVGGDSGLFGSTQEAFCSGARLTGPEQKALDIFREAAPPPADILNQDISTDALVNGTTLGEQPSQGSIRERLADAWGTDAIPPTTPLWEPYGLRESDFDVARQALGDEISIFGRTQTAQLAPRPLADGLPPIYERWAGTSGEPPDRPDEYWALLTLIETKDEGMFGKATGLSWRPAGSDFDRYFPEGTIALADNLTSFVDHAYSWAQLIQSSEMVNDPLLDGADDALLNPLALMLGTDLSKGRLIHCTDYQGDEDLTHTIRALGFDAADQVTLVRGQDLLDCAVNGHVEGTECTLPNILSLAPVASDGSILRLTTEIDNDVGPFQKEVKTTFAYPIPVEGRYYLIRPRLRGDTNPGAGDWELLLGTPLFVQDEFGPEGQFCRDVPIVSEAIELAAKALAPSREWCGESEVSCAGVRFDDKLPLEDELTDDGNGVESSWRHYLELARRAAEHADALGQEYIEAALRDDLREEEIDLRSQAKEDRASAEFQRVQEICGTAADPSVLMKFFGANLDGDLDLSDALQVCTPPAAGARGPACISTLIGQNPQLGELYQCLHSFTTPVEKHLGNASLCVKNDPGPEEVPVEIRACTANSDCGANARCLPGTPDSPELPGGLGLFDTKSVLPEAPLPSLCNAIRGLRDNPNLNDPDQASLLEKIQRNSAFTEESLSGLTSSVTMRYPDTMEISLGGVVISTTTNPSSAEQTQICGTAREATCNGLLCQRWDCSNQADRAELNLRLYLAGAALLQSLPGSRVRAMPAIWYLNPWVINEDNTFGRSHLEGFPAGSGIALGHGFVDYFSEVIFHGRNSKPPIPELDPRRMAFSMGLLPGGGPRIFDIQGDLPLDTEGQEVGAGITPLVLPMHFAIYYAPVDMAPDAMSRFWGGLGNTGAPPGYYLSVMSGNSTDPGIIEIPASSSLDAPLGGMPGCSQRMNDYNIHGDPPVDISKGCALKIFGPFGTGEQPTLRRPLPHGLHTAIFGSSEADPVAPLQLEAVSNPNGTAYHPGDLTLLGVQAFPEPPPVVPGNPPGDNLFPVGTATLQLTQEARLDALELVCEGLVAGGLDPTLNEGCGVPPDITSAEDFDEMGSFLECLGAEIINRASTAVYELPPGAAEDLSNGERAFDATGGRLHVAISQLRTNLLEAATSGPIVGGTLRRFGADVRALQARLKSFGINSDISDLQLEAGIANQTTACLAAAASSIDVTNWGAPAAAIATCANSVAQIGFAIEVNALEEQLNITTQQETIAEFSGRTSDYITTLETQAIRLSQALEGIQGQLEIIEGLKAEAQRALATAAWQLSKQARNQPMITQALENIQVGKQVRYSRAFEDAKRMAFLAKRAIELRLGLSLGDMTQDLPLVTAPASWASELCESSGINYAALRRTESTNVGEVYADKFIGDYVSKLDQVVESYRLVNGFHEGSDTAVVSLRDDIHNTRTLCDTASPNLFLHASQLLPFSATPTPEELGWKNSGCIPNVGPAPDAVETPTNCISFDERSDAPFFDPLAGPPMPGWDVGFGGESCIEPFCTFQEGAALVQELTLSAGRYRFSWYTTDIEGAGGAIAGFARDAAGTVFDVAQDSEGVDLNGFVEGESDDWNRVYFAFDVPKDSVVTVGFERPTELDDVLPLAAPMLEHLDDPLHYFTLREPQPFVDSDGGGNFRGAVCEDTSGIVFRNQRWDHNCVNLCPDGYSSDCTDHTQTECFWESSFHVSQRAIEAGHLFNQSGFARGNFNYRLRAIALNFVGSDLRDCESSTLPSTCYSAGFIPYSIIHAGPYFVRNHKGQDYRAPLFTGHIEHARGLATERYLTNPLGESDRGLLQPYMRSELNGRPLDGEFIIRIWDEPGVDFNAIQDVQIVLDYGYWTRFD